MEKRNNRDNQDNQVGPESHIAAPSELEGKNLGGVFLQQEQGGSDGGGVVAAPEQSKSQKIDHIDKYAKHLHLYIREYISTADRKAAFAFAISGALLVYLYEEGFSNLWIKDVSLWAFSELFAFVATMGLGVSCLLSIIVVVPFLRGSKRGLVFWESIMEFTNSSEFSKELFRLSDDQLTEEIIKHSYELAQACGRKYKLLNWSLRIGAIGAICTLLILVKG